MALTRLIVVGGFLTAFVAGLLVGSVRHVAPAIATTQPSGRPDRASWLAQQLDLTPDQQQQMRQIWSEVSRRGPGPSTRRSQNRRERDEAIKSLIPPEKLPAYEKIYADYEAKNEADEKESKQGFERAVERTKALLTPEQRAKYEVLMERQGWGQHHRGQPGTRPARN